MASRSREEIKAELESRSLHHIADMEQWPGMICPLIRYKPNTRGGMDKECGYMIDNKVPVMVFVGNMFAMEPTDLVIAYNDLGAIIRDGWLVD